MSLTIIQKSKSIRKRMLAKQKSKKGYLSNGKKQRVERENLQTKDRKE